MKSENILDAFHGGHIVVNLLSVVKETSGELRGGQTHIVSVLGWVLDEIKLTFSEKALDAASLVSCVIDNFGHDHDHVHEEK